MSQTQKEVQRIRIIHSYRVSHKCNTLLFSIPHDIRKQYGLDKPTSLYVIPKKDGILLRKVDLEGIK
jgi:hypothetical protein